MRSRALALAALLLLLAPLRLAGADPLYRWVDAQGRLHLSDDLARVPDAQRAAAERSAGEPREPQANWNELDVPPAALARESSPSSESHNAPRRHQIPVARAGLELALQATLNGRTEGHFKVDTGATLNTLPRRVALKLGLDVSEHAPSTVVSGISGEPKLVPLVTLREVQIGTAIVQDVEMAVLDTMEYGLLGMPFFNHFRVQTDPVRGLLTLDEIDLDGIEGIYGGYDEVYWRSRFGLIRLQQGRIESYRDSIPKEYAGMHQQARQSADYWQNQYELLDLKASLAGVPPAWRE